MLKQAGLRYTYSSEDSSIVKDFYVPALKSSCYYDRAVGFFSSASLSIAARGLAPLLQSGGTMRLIIGYPVSTEDFDAIQNGIGIGPHLTVIQQKSADFFANLQTNLECRRFDSLSFLVATNRLQIRFAFRPRGMYHEKIGIIRDAAYDRVAFIGSANETENALCDDLNSESINTYFSWDEAIYKCYGLDIEDRFERLWRDELPVTKTVPASAEFIAQLAAYHDGKDVTRIINELQQLEQVIQEKSWEPFRELPELPAFIGRHKYQLREHQKEALASWIKQKYHGILKLATGAGKTITALHASTVLSTHKHFARGLCVVVAVPYQGLAEQWHEEMKAFNIHALLCYKSQNIWLQEFKNRIAEFNIATTQTFLGIVVVNDTLKKSTFLDEINKVPSDRLLFIGDECHNHANSRLINILPKARLRLGLSATPWTDSEIDKRDILTGYYGEVAAEYGLKEAIDDKVLCPYDYFPIICEMNNDEADNYEALSAKIAQMESIKESGGIVNEDVLMHLYLKRTRLLGNIISKIEHLDRLVQEKGVQTHTLFYCGEGGGENNFEDDEKTIDEVTKILHQRGWRTSKFTSEQSLSMRKQIMENFKNGEIDALVSKRVLDEGIDIPACSQAFIMASSRNERQYVQRRGRVLRRAPNKDKAVIYDFVTIPPVGRKHQNCFASMMQQELRRVEDFSSLSLNKLRMDYDNEY
ncbi:DEAD/DEAH box helicase family protein [Aeromonas enteropelogenes]|uniref:DEAD/DEAH box helicase family protein n=1 Tax=Aeromonas enteropelogenes TaxID=29489 RepID=A0ABU9JC14_AEREN